MCHDNRQDVCAYMYSWNQNEVSFSCLICVTDDSSLKLLYDLSDWKVYSTVLMFYLLKTIKSFYPLQFCRILLHQPVPISFKSPPMQTKFQPIIEDSQAYIWLCFCFLLTLKPVSSDEEGLNPKNAFELAISFLPSGEGLLDVCLQ